jgi:RNA polymerase sigma factor (sigma-70 family)
MRVKPLDTMDVALYERLLPIARRYARGSDPMELLSEAWLKLLRTGVDKTLMMPYATIGCETPEGRAGYSFFKHVLKSVAIDRWRASKSSARGFGTTTGQLPEMSRTRFGRSIPTPLDVLLYREQNERVQRKVMQLRDGDRELALLKYFHGFPPKQLADILDLKRKTAEKKLARAKQRLRTSWRGEFDVNLMVREEDSYKDEL